MFQVSKAQTTEHGQQPVIRAAESGIRRLAGALRSGPLVAGCLQPEPEAADPDGDCLPLLLEPDPADRGEPHRTSRGTLPEVPLHREPPLVHLELGPARVPPPPQQLHDATSGGSALQRPALLPGHRAYHIPGLPPAPASA